MNLICRIIVLFAVTIVLSASVIGCTYHEHYHMGKPETVIER